MPHSPEEKRAFVIGYFCALAHNRPLISLNSMDLGVALAEKWDIELTPETAREYDQDFVNIGLLPADMAAPIDKEKLN